MTIFAGCARPDAAAVGARVFHSDCISAARCGEAGALERFCRTWVAIARRWFARRWARSALRSFVDDGVQEFMLECCRRDGALARFDARQGTACAAFLRGVAANVAARIERREARRAARCRHLGANVHYVPAAAADDGAGSLRDRVEAARAGLARAGDRGRLVAEVLRLNVDSGLPVRTIARRWGCPAEQVHALRRRAIRMLRRRLQGFASA